MIICEKVSIRLIATVALAFVASFAVAQDYDLVILNCGVMDPESKFYDVRKVGIKDGKITTITEQPISGAESVDASGHVITAGFIDPHFHSLDKIAVKFAL